jgi:hypothetical protein
MSNKELNSEINHLLQKIDSKRIFDDYTMTELEKIARKAKKLIPNAEKNKEIQDTLSHSITLSDRYHKIGEFTSQSNIMEILREVKFSLEQYLENN